MALHRIGNYELLGELGRGGMGVVYLGVDSFIKRQVAIKTIYLSEIQDQEERQFLKQRLYREAQSAGILSHPNIVTIYQIGEQDEITYIAMEYVEGSNLADLLRKPEKPTPELLLGIFEQTAAALDHAHRHGVIHRDVKPANIIVRPDGMAKITDFGVAKISAQSVTRTGMTLGTPHFMAPEQIQGKQIDGTADQYSLGVVMYEILTGKKPFTADSMTTLIFRIVSDPVNPKQDNPRMSDVTAGVLKRALAKNPEDRFPNCMALAQALRESVSGGNPVAGLSSALPIPTPAQGTPGLQAPPPTASMPIPKPSADREPTSAPQSLHSSQAVPVPPTGTTAPPRPRETRDASRPRQPVAPTPMPRTPEPWETQRSTGASWLAPAVILAVLGVAGAGIAIFYLLGGMSIFSPKPTIVAEEKVSQPNDETGAQEPDSAEARVAPGSSQSPSGDTAAAASSDPLPGAQTQAGPGTQSGSVAINTTGPASSSSTQQGNTPAAKPAAGTSGNPASGRVGAGGREETSASSGNRRTPQNAATGRQNAGEATATGPGTTGPGGIVPDTPGNNPSTPAEKPRPAVVTSPRPVVRAPAIYPAAARRDGVSGTVGLRAVINAKGEPTNIEVTKGIRPDLDEAAKTALSKWRFQPGTSDGQPIEAPVNVEISFNLVQDQRRPASLRNP